MEYFLTFEDRQALVKRAHEDTGGRGWEDYYGMLVEMTLMYPTQLDEIKNQRNQNKPTQKEKPKFEDEELFKEPANQKPTFLRIVK